jgi:hypothetical protein
MSTRVLHRGFVAAVAFVMLSVAAGAHAGLFRAYLSAKGSDANPCTLAAPCRLLPAALAAVNDGGEIWMLDSANYNTATVSIAKSVTILAVPGALGSVLAPANQRALLVNAVDVRVTARNLVIVGANGTGTGIDLLNGAELTVEDCEISMLHIGIVAGASPLRPAKATLRNTVVRNNASIGVSVYGPTNAVLDGVRTTGNDFGVYAQGGASVNVTNSLIAHNRIGAQARASANNTQIVVGRSTVTSNVTALRVSAEVGGAGIVSDGNVITYISGTVFEFDQGPGGVTVIWTRNNNTLGYFNQDITPGHALTPLGVY